jgi:tetratricopeptide (TPR) repeat protein
MNRSLLAPAIALTVLVVFGYYYFQFMAHEEVPGQNRYRLANKLLEDSRHEEALEVFDEVIAVYPEYKEAHLGRAITLMQMNESEGALESFDRAIRLDGDFAAAYANRGILNDRLGRYEDAVTDYRRAIELAPGLAEGPGFFWRFLRNIPEKPPTIADRARYLQEELKKPEGERLLRVPEMDARQRMYKK